MMALAAGGRGDVLPGDSWLERPTMQAGTAGEELFEQGFLFVASSHNTMELTGRGPIG
jgi:hypothetical protein